MKALLVFILLATLAARSLACEKNALTCYGCPGVCRDCDSYWFYPDYCYWSKIQGCNWCIKIYAQPYSTTEPHQPILSEFRFCHKESLDTDVYWSALKADCARASIDLDQYDTFNPCIVLPCLDSKSEVKHYVMCTCKGNRCNKASTLGMRSLALGSVFQLAIFLLLFR